MVIKRERKTYSYYYNCIFDIDVFYRKSIIEWLDEIMSPVWDTLYIPLNIDNGIDENMLFISYSRFALHQLIKAGDEL